jgi:hypothetical protein
MSTSSKGPSSNARMAAMLLVLVPVIALPGVVGTDNLRLGKPAAGGYTLRCWQDGRLILEEQHVSLPPIVDAQSTRLHMADRQQQPVIVAETKNATCLVKARPVERPRSTLP